MCVVEDWSETRAKQTLVNRRDWRIGGAIAFDEVGQPMVYWMESIHFFAVEKNSVVINEDSRYVF